MSLTPEEAIVRAMNAAAERMMHFFVGSNPNVSAYRARHIAEAAFLYGHEFGVRQTIQALDAVAADNPETLAAFRRGLHASGADDEQGLWRGL
jgi:hypothetical protein